MGNEFFLIVTWRFSFHLKLHLLAAIIAFLFAGSKGIAQNSKILIVQDYEYPGRDPAIWDGLYAAWDRKVYSGLITEGVSAHFYVYEPAIKKNRMLADMAEFFNERGKGIRTAGKLHNKP